MGAAGLPSVRALSVPTTEVVEGEGETGALTTCWVKSPTSWIYPASPAFRSDTSISSGPSPSVRWQRSTPERALSPSHPIHPDESHDSKDRAGSDRRSEAADRRSDAGGGARDASAERTRRVSRRQRVQ